MSHYISNRDTTEKSNSKFGFGCITPDKFQVLFEVYFLTFVSFKSGNDFYRKLQVDYTPNFGA